MKYEVLEHVWPFLTSTRLHDLILSLHLEGEARKVPGIHGKYIQKLLMHLKALEETSQTGMAALEWFVVLLYDRTSDFYYVQVNNARKQLFTQKSRNLENIHPTYAALKLSSILLEPGISS